MGRRSHAAQSAAALLAPVPLMPIEFVAADFIPPTALRWVAFLRSAMERGWQLAAAIAGTGNEPGAGAGAPENVAQGGTIPLANAPEGSILAGLPAVAVTPLMGSLHGILHDEAA